MLLLTYTNLSTDICKYCNSIINNSRVSSYVCALRDLGVEASEALQSGAAVCVLSDPVHCETPNVIDALDGVVAVLATPPNSYSAVTDPIDLVCGRGGDLAMLEVNTLCKTPTS